MFIHGVMPDEQGAKHTADYDALHGGVGNELGEGSSWSRAERVDIEWGWNFDGAPQPQGHRLLTKAEHSLFPKVLEDLFSPSDPTLNPARLVVNRLRELMLFGIGDVFYYVSEDGKYTLREAVAKQLQEQLGDTLTSDEHLLSLTLVGHSLGSVVAFDLAFWLFWDQQHRYLRDGIDAQTQALLETLRAKAQQGRLRIRRLFTFGSPIALLAMRSNTVLEILAGDDRIDPRHHGLLQNPPAFEEQLSALRWVNVLDRDDPIAWPVRPLMKAPGEVVQDAYIDVSDRPAVAHGKYWRHPDVHAKLAEAW